MDSTLSTPGSPAMTPSRRARQQRERIKLFSQLTLLTTSADGKVDTLLKVDDCPQVDDSSLILLSLPNGPQHGSDPFDDTFHSFCITSQSGQRIYGGSYVFAHKTTDPSAAEQSSVIYTSRALVALVVRPLVDELHRCLEWCVRTANCNARWLRCVAQIRLPPKGKCIKVSLPKVGRKQSTDSHEHRQPKTAEITIYRPLTALPLFDYPLRRLFTSVLSVDQFLLCYCCALSETQILVMSRNYYTLMLVAESLTQLLNPFKWQHVYVPILPNKLGTHYLDAPTPYIMGINKSANVQTSSLNVGCVIDCDHNSVEVNVEPHLLIVPPFIDTLKHELEAILNSDLRLSSSAVGPKKSDALKRLTELAKKHNVIADTFDYLDDLKLNQQIRVLFLKTIRKNILHKYQQFIVTSTNKKDGIRFDAVSYLSDQPQSMQPFLTQFVETQMFVSFIDETAKQLVRKQKAFNIQSQTTGEQALYESLYDDDYEELDLSLFTDLILESRFNSAKQIELEDLELLPGAQTADNNNTLPADPTKLATASPRTRRRLQTMSPRHLPKESNLVNSSVLASPSKSMPAALTAQTNWRVVETLMREVKLKTKRILLEKMGSDEVRPLGCGTVGGVEENTLIAALCDLIERIWSHARSEDNKDLNQWQTGKCSFWSHLMAYYQMETSDGGHQNKAIDSSQLSPALAWILFKKRIDSLSQISIDSSSTPSSPSKQHPNTNPMKPLPQTLIYDIRSVRCMTDIKTDVGKSRAFIRLALERKLLSKHLRTLLLNHDLLITLYKRYAFLRCEEEREQFLTHLLTLNAVDLMCFTNTFTSSVLPYTLIIHGSTQLNGWFSITGTNGSTSENIVVSGQNCCTFRHRNMGMLNTLTICASANSKIFIEYCFVRNEVTNHIYKFVCHRWFGRNIDDGSTERVLIGELMSGTITDVLKRTNQMRSSSIGRHWTRANDRYSDDNEQTLTVEDLQTMLGENVNQIMKFYYNNAHNQSVGGDHSSATDASNTGHQLHDLRQQKIDRKPANGFATTHRPDRHRTRPVAKTLQYLIFGDKKLLWILSRIFYLGFKNRGRSSFRKQCYLWDYLMRIVCELKIARTAHKISDQTSDQFIDLVDKITNCAPNYGKDSKFELFLLLSLRDHHLSPAFLGLMSRPSLSVLFYETESFVRSVTLVTFLVQILNTFNDIELTFESALTKAL